jgi:hypothetical protein
MTIDHWLKSNVPSYMPRAVPPISVEVEGVFINPANWATAEFGPDTRVRIYPEPKAIGAGAAALWALAAAVLITGIIILTRKPLSTPESNSTSGKSINLARTTGNQVKIGDVIREAAGTNEIFPDYMTPLRRYFGSNPKEQWVEMLLCIGVGEFQIDPGQVRIGGTSIASLGSTASYTIYGPGQSLTSELARLWWHSSDEVGSTSTGSAGLTLTTTTDIDQEVSADTLQFNGFVVTVPESVGWFPTGWISGLVARIEAPYLYTFTAGAGGSATVISGEHLPMLKAFVGMKIEMTGANAGEYVVASYTAPVPAVPAAPGSASTVLGNAAPARYDYSTTPLTFSVGGGPVLNLLPDTYSWLTSATLPAVVTNANTTVTGIAVASAASGFGYQVTTGSTSTGLWFMLCPTNNAAGWNVPLPAGVHTISFEASSSIDGATIQPAIWNGAVILGATVSLSATLTRYNVTVTVPTASTFGVMFYVNRAGINGNNLVIHSAQVSKGTTAVSFTRGTRVVTLNTSTGNIAGLVSALNSRLSGSGIVASASGAVVKLAEAGSPFSGNALTLAGTATDVFGAAPVFATGTKTTTETAAQLAKMTLAYDGGAPATGLQTGAQWSAIGYRGLRHRITAVADDAEEDDTDTPAVDESHGPSSITVTRLTDTGADDSTWTGFDFLETGSGRVILDGSTTEGDWAGPFTVLPTGEVTDRVEVDFHFPQGLIRYTEKNANARQATVHVEVQYRDARTAGAWTSVSYSFTAKTQDQLGFTKRIITASKIYPEYRIRRIGEESTSTTKFDRIQWYGLRGRIDKHKDAYEDVTVMALYVRGGDRLSAQAESQVSVIATRKLPVLGDGVWSEKVATRDIVPWVNYVAKSAGATDSDLAIDELERLGAIWSGRQDYFDYKVEDDSTVKECINDALLAGFAEFTLERGRITPVRDEPRTQIGKMYTPLNMTSTLKRGFSLPAPDDYDGVVVKYIDEVTNAEEPVDCSLPGDAKLTVQTITLRGVRNRDKAWRIGRRRRRAQIYQNKSYSWSTELDALNSGYLSYDAVADDIPGYGQSSILEAVTDGVGPVILESTDPFAWTDGASHVVALRRPDGTISGPWAASRLSEYRLAVPTIDFEPDLSWEIEPPHLLFGTTTRWCYPVLVTSIEPGDYSADMEAVNYDARVYADDNNFAPVED